MEATVLTKVVLPIALFVIMLGMGLSLKVADFARILREPKAAVVGITMQMLMLPILGYATVKVFNLGPELAVGLFILAICPGGTTSNMISFLSRGDLALSISLTAVVSLVTPFTIPILANIAMVQLMGEGDALVLPFGQTVIQLVVITVVPVLAGMLIHKKAPRFSARAEKPIKILSIVFLFGIIGAILKDEWSNMPTFLGQVGLAATVLSVSGMTLGYFGSLGLRLTRKQAVTVGIEVGIQNGTTALLITGTLLHNSTMSIAPAVYSLVMFGTGAVFGILVNIGQDTVESPGSGG